MLRRFCRKCGSQFMLQDNEVHTKCPVHRSTTPTPPKPKGNARPKAKARSKNKP